MTVDVKFFIKCQNAAAVIVSLHVLMISRVARSVVQFCKFVGHVIHGKGQFQLLDIVI